MDPFVAEIRIFGFGFAPHGWAFCDGQLLPVSQNTALFSLVGATYGGDGQVTFGLPDLRGRVPVQPGQGPGLSLYDLGEAGGLESVALVQSELPVHTHPLRADTVDPADTNVPSPAASFARSTGGEMYASTADTSLAADALSPVPGGGQPHPNMQPSLTLNFCIALQGVFPSRP